ncbi:MAG: porin [Bacteroidaceae bacterium]|nr:porin [Bacteroidaceae bacterium]
MNIKHAALVIILAIFTTSSVKAQLVMNEEFIDGYDHSLQNYLTEKIATWKSKAEEADKKNTEGKKKWKIADYVTVPKFGGYVVATYKYDSQEGKNGGDGFGLRYLRLYLDGKVFNDFSYRVQMNVSGEPGTKNGARVIDAFVAWQKWKFIGVKIGEYKRCFTFENPMNPWDVCLGDYTQLTKHFAGMGGDFYKGAANSGGRDLGVQIYGDAIKVGKTQHYLLHYQAGIYNGQGINTSDKDKEKDYIATLQVQPIKGLYVGLFGWSGSFFDGAQSNYFKRWAAGVSYEGLFSARAEYARNIYANGANTNGLGQKSDAWYIRMGIPTWRWLRVNLGYDAYRSDMSSWTSLNSIYSLALQARPHKNLQFQVQWNYCHNNGDATKLDKNYHQLWTQAYIRF